MSQANKVIENPGFQKETKCNTFVSGCAHYIIYNGDLSIGVFPYVVFLQKCLQGLFFWYNLDFNNTMAHNG